MHRRGLSQHDYETNLAAKADIDAVLEINNRQLEMIAELQEVLRHLDHDKPTGLRRSPVPRW
jgi:hypothetical protein